MFKSILVPIDLADTDLAKPAIATAATLSQTWNGSVRLLNVLPMTPVMLAEYVPADPGSDGGGIEPAALVETAVLVMARRRVVFGLGVTQQHQTAHGRDLDSVLVSTNLQAHVRDRVTSAAAVRKKRHAREFHKCDQRPRRRRAFSLASVVRPGC